MKKILLYTVTAIAAAGAGTWLALYLHDPEVESIQPAGTPEYRPEFSLRDLDGEMRAFSEWDGRVTVVNFWATWCAPCRREIPILIAAQDSYGDDLAVLGIAIDEVDAVRQYTAEMGFNYPTLIGQLDAIDVARKFGNRIGALPYTAIVDSDGRIRWTHAGEFDEPALTEALAPLID